MANQESKIKRRVYSYINKMSKYTGADIKKEQYPEVKITTRNSSMYNPDTNTLIISRKDAHSGDAIGEEIGHYMRAQLRPEQNYKREKITGEFFGYLGRRILNQVGPDQNLRFQLDRGIGTKKEALTSIKQHKQKSREYEQYSSGKKNDPDGILTPKYAKLRAENEKAKRREILEHYRGYEIAEQVDLNKMNYKEVYSLPDKEVRSRFFRQDKQYDLTQEIKPGVITRNLEGKVALILLGVILIALFFYRSTITGNSIIEVSKQNFSFVIIGIIGVVGIYFVYRFVTNKLLQ